MSNQPSIGAHVSSSGGLINAIKNAKLIEADSFQIFPGPPQMWRHTQYTNEAIDDFIKLRAQSAINEIWIHNIYLANMAADGDEHLEKSINSVKDALILASKIGAEGVVLHTGSHKGKGFNKVQRKVISSIKNVLKDAPKDTKLALENAAGQGGSIGSDFEELFYLIDRINDQRLGVCLDTCHAFAAGYDLRKKDIIAKIVQDFSQSISIEKLFVFHANDSLMELGSQKDRHDNIGEGHIGVKGFKHLLNNKNFKNLSFILEVPGFPSEDKKSKGPDLENVQRLKNLL
ncbi:MAG: deoxyribonuclease IV [Dehalococcoidia bacterium]